MASNSTEATVKLQTLDDQTFEIPVRIAKMSLTLADMLESKHVTGISTMKVEVNAKIMAMIISWCEYHIANPTPEVDEDKKDEKRLDDIIPWDQEFCKVSNLILLELAHVSNYLLIDELFQLACKSLAILIKGKSVEEIRTVLNVVNDLSPEEEERIRKETEWCIDK